MQNKSITFLIVMLSILIVNVNSNYMISSAEYDYDFSHSSYDAQINNALDFLQEQQANDGNIGGFAVSAWASMAIASAGEDPNDWSKLVSYLEEKTNLLDDKATDWERQTLAIVACNKNPQNFADTDFVKKIISFYDGNQIGSTGNLFDDYFGILALISAGVDKNESIIQNTRSYIISKQNSNGGWGDSDSTSAAIMALIAAGEDKNAIVITNAFSFLKTLQTADGGFHSWGNTNTASTAWVVMAINSIEGNPASNEWEKNGNTPLDYLLALQQEDGSFNWTASRRNGPEWMTSYVIPALLGKTYPIKISEESYIIDDDPIDTEDPQKTKPDVVDTCEDNIKSEKITISVDKDATIINPSKDTYYFLNQKLLCKNSKLVPKKPVVFGFLDIQVETNKDVSKVEFYINNELTHVDSEKPFNYILNNLSFFKNTKITIKPYIFKNITVDYSIFLEKIQKILDMLEKSELFDFISDYFKPVEVYALTAGDISEIEIIYTNLFPNKYSNIF